MILNTSKNIISSSIEKEIDVDIQKAGNRDEIKAIYPDILKMSGINTTIVEED